MKKYFLLNLLILLILLTLSTPRGILAATITVPSGGSISSALNSANPGDTILVSDGTYPALTINKGGTSANWITIKSQKPWGAKIAGSPGSGIGVTFTGSGNYIRLEDFDISGFDSGIYSNQAASHLYIGSNHLHDLGRECSDSVYGLDGMYIHGVSDITLDGNTFNNIGRYANGENGCQNSTSNYQNHDHAIYIDGGNSVAITNNVFYNNTSGWDIHVYSSSGLTTTNLTISNNTFAFLNPYRPGQIIFAGNLTNASVFKNIFYQPTTSAISVSSAAYTNVSISQNLTTTSGVLDNSANGITTSSNITNTDPKFVNPTNSDFHLQAGSPAAGLGAYPNPVGSVNPPVPTGIGGSWNLVFDDEFNDTTLNTSKWSECYPWDCHSGGNGELMVYTALNNLFDGSTLSEEAVKQQTCDGGYCAAYGSSLIQTGAPIGSSTPKFTFTYGFTEAKIQVPYGTGYFPAFWMLGPQSEIDLMEVFGNTTNFSCGVHLGHYTGSWSCNTHGANTPSSWHIFGVDWEPDHLTFYYDGQVVGSTTDTAKIPADAMYLLLNFAVGANFIPAPDSTTVFPAYLKTDYVRVWKFTLPQPTGEGVPGDYNNDGKVDGLDYVYVLIHLGTTTTLADLNTVIANIQ